MRQFDVYANPSKVSAQFAPYLVALQSHHLEGLDSVVVAPLLRDAERLLAPLDIAVLVAGESLTLATAELFAIDRALLSRRVGDLREHEDAIRRALDRLFTGF